MPNLKGQPRMGSFVCFLFFGSRNVSIINSVPYQFGSILFCFRLILAVFNLAAYLVYFAILRNILVEQLW